MSETSDRAFQVGDPCPLHPARRLESRRPTIRELGTGRQERLYCLAGGTWSTAHYLCARAGCAEPVNYRRTFCTSRCRLIAWRAMKRAAVATGPVGVSPGE